LTVFAGNKLAEILTQSLFFNAVFDRNVHLFSNVSRSKRDANFLILAIDLVRKAILKTLK
jgi:hypothetical protein